MKAFAILFEDVEDWERRGKRTMVRVVRLSPIISRLDFSPGSVEIEEYEA